MDKKAISPPYPVVLGLTLVFLSALAFFAGLEPKEYQAIDLINAGITIKIWFLLFFIFSFIVTGLIFRACRPGSAAAKRNHSHA